jgi:zinc transporter ZupT
MKGGANRQCYRTLGHGPAGGHGEEDCCHDPRHAHGTPTTHAYGDAGGGHGHGAKPLELNGLVETSTPPTTPPSTPGHGHGPAGGHGASAGAIVLELPDPGHGHGAKATAAAAAKGGGVHNDDCECGHAHGGGGAAGSKGGSARLAGGRGCACEPGNWAPVAWSVLIGDLLHNFVDGIAIGVAFRSCGPDFGWVVASGAAAHEVTQELADFIVLITRGRMSVGAALGLNLLSALSCVLGVLRIYE